MSSRALGALLLAASIMPAAYGQFELFVVDGNVEHPVPAVYDFGSFYAGETATAHFRLRNTSVKPATLSVLAVAGAGFSLTAPALPVSLAPQAVIELTVGFRAAETGSYSAALRSEGISVFLIVTVLPRLTYEVDTGTGFRPLVATVDFGTVARGNSVVRHFKIENLTPLILTVPGIAVKGAGFALTAAAPSGAALQPGQTSGFDVQFAPIVTGAGSGSLVIDDRTYALTGTANDPALPQPQLAIDLKTPASAQQGVVTVQFAASGSSGTGTVTLDFQGAADPTIAFVSGGRTVTFGVSPGDTQVSFPFQTGTTAGTLVFTVRLGAATASETIAIPATPVAITAVQAMRPGGSLEVRVTGFDNTRTLSQLNFTFYDVSGNAISPGTIRADAAAEFARYFQASDLGGTFMLRAVFPVAGNAAGISGVEVQLTNSVGATKTERTVF